MSLPAGACEPPDKARFTSMGTVTGSGLRIFPYEGGDEWIGFEDGVAH
jgi:hypothetical protein